MLPEKDLRSYLLVLERQMEAIKTRLGYEDFPMEELAKVTKEYEEIRNQKRTVMWILEDPNWEKV